MFEQRGNMGEASSAVRAGEHTGRGRLPTSERRKPLVREQIARVTVALFTQKRGGSPRPRVTTSPRPSASPPAPCGATSPPRRATCALCRRPPWTAWASLCAPDLPVCHWSTTWRVEVPSPKRPSGSKHRSATSSAWHGKSPVSWRSGSRCTTPPNSSSPGSSPSAPETTPTPCSLEYAQQPSTQPYGWRPRNGPIDRSWSTRPH